MNRSRHPKKAIEEAIRLAESLGWRVLEGRGHWGYLYCPLKDRDGCKIRVDSTPKNPENYAKGLLRQIVKCPHSEEQGREE